MRARLWKLASSVLNALRLSSIGLIHIIYRYKLDASLPALGTCVFKGDSTASISTRFAYGPETVLLLLRVIAVFGHRPPENNRKSISYG